MAGTSIVLQDMEAEIVPVEPQCGVEIVGEHRVVVERLDDADGR